MEIAEKEMASTSWSVVKRDVSVGRSRQRVSAMSLTSGSHTYRLNTPWWGGTPTSLPYNPFDFALVSAFTAFDARYQLTSAIYLWRFFIARSRVEWPWISITSVDGSVEIGRRLLFKGFLNNKKTNLFL